MFEVNIVEWARVCRIVNLDPDKIRRALGPAHKELLERGYLKEVEYLGRGKNQQIRYVFAQQLVLALTPVQLALAERLMLEGVGRPQAFRLVTDIAASQIEQQLLLAQELLKRQRGIRNRGGFISDVVRDTEGKYVHPEGIKDKVVETRAAVWKEDDRWSEQVEEEARAVAELSPAEQAEKLLLGRKLGAQAARFDRACRSGELRAYDVHEGAVKAFARLEGETFITELLEKLRALP